MAALSDGAVPPEPARHQLADDAAAVVGRYWEL
jgi:hypothetical protein